MPFSFEAAVAGRQPHPKDGVETRYIVVEALSEHAIAQTLAWQGAYFNLLQHLALVTCMLPSTWSCDPCQLQWDQDGIPCDAAAANAASTDRAASPKVPSGSKNVSSSDCSWHLPRRSVKPSSSTSSSPKVQQGRFDALECSNYDVTPTMNSTPVQPTDVPTSAVASPAVVDDFETVLAEHAALVRASPGLLQPASSAGHSSTGFLLPADIHAARCCSRATCQFLLRRSTSETEPISSCTIGLDHAISSGASDHVEETCTGDDADECDLDPQPCQTDCFAADNPRLRCSRCHALHMDFECFTFNGAVRCYTCSPDMWHLAYGTVYGPDDLRGALLDDGGDVHYRDAEDAEY